MLFPSLPEFIGRYQVVKELKSGGMGTVFLARDPRIGKHMGGRFIAIKVLQEFDDVELRARFEREADIAGTLDHRNIVQIYDRDEFDGRPFIVMEFVDGRTLSELIDTGTVPLVRKLQWMEELCDGLACAHNSGVVHRDIKPANVMIRAVDGVLKILDFGIARANTIKANMTRGILGTLNYMAPEQWDATVSVDSRADAFAAGAVFYELLSGEKAFPGNDVPSIYRQISSQPPEPLEKRHPNLDPDLIAIVNRCLEKRPADRYPDMVAVRADLAVVRQRLTARDAAVTMVRPARTFVKEAQRALEQGDFTLALKACEQALLMEPDNTAARDVEQRARTAIQVENWLRDARGEFERGALTAASMLIDQILAVSESQPDALSIRMEIDAVRRELERARQIEAALVRARESLDAGALDEAGAAFADLLELDPENADAAALRGRLEADIAARQTVAEARRQFGAGHHADAMAMLQQYAPPHMTVGAALAELRAEYQEIERRRQAAERRRREEEERRAKELEEARQEEQRQIAAANERARQAIAEARRLFSAGDYPAAIQLLETHQPPHADVTAALETLRGKVADIERQRIDAERRKNEAEQRKKEEERQRAEAERQEEQRQIAAANERARQTVADARRRFSAGDRAAALQLLERHQPPHPNVTLALSALRVEIADLERVEAERRKSEAEQRKKEEERQRAEAERRKQDQERLDAERRKQQQEQLDAKRRKEEEDARQRLAAERQKQEEARVEADRRQAEEQRRQAQKRAEEQARRDEEKRRQAQAAAAAAQQSTGDDATVQLKGPVQPPRETPILTTPAKVTRPAGQPKGVDRRTLAAAAAIVIAVAVFGTMKWRSGSGDLSTAQPPAAAKDSPTPASSPVSSPAAPLPSSTAVTPPPATTAPVQPEPATPAPTPSAPPASAEPPASAAIDARVAALRATAQQQWARDERVQAMTTLAAGLQLKPGDAEISRLSTGFIRQMSERSANAATAARNAGAPDSPGSPFDDARRRIRDAVAFERAGRADQSVRAYDDAINLFAKAIASAKVAVPGRANTPAPQPPPTGTVASADAGTNANTAAGRATAPPPAVEPSPAPAPPPAVSPAPAPPPPALPAGNAANAANLVAEESAVRQTLQRYRDAYQSMSAAAVQAVYPRIDARKLQDVFKLYTSLRQDLEIDRVEVAPDGQTATVTGTVITAPVVKTGRAAPQRSKALFRLKKNGDIWLIQDVSLK